MPEVWGLTTLLVDASDDQEAERLATWPSVGGSAGCCLRNSVPEFVPAGEGRPMNRAARIHRTPRVRGRGRART